MLFRSLLSPENKELSDKIFDAVLLDYEGTQEKFDVISKIASVETFNGWYIRAWRQEGKNVEVLARYKKGQAIDLKVEDENLRILRIRKSD